MFSITVSDAGEVQMAGRLDASKVEEADKVLQSLTETSRVNLKDLEYISSAGLGVLLKAQKRLKISGKEIVLTGMNKLVGDVFRIARLDAVFRIE